MIRDCIARGAAVACAFAAASPLVQAAHPGYFELHAFLQSEGTNPDHPALMAQGWDGNLYGTLPFGGTSGEGSAFSYWLAAGSFVPDPLPYDGGPADTPYSGLSLAFDGSFYGSTQWGGALHLGSVIQVSGSGAPSTIASFANGPDGEHPWAPPVQAWDGYLYGVTKASATTGNAYRVPASGTPPRAIQGLGALPSGTDAPLVLGGDGQLYGTTPGGGKWQCGTVFRIDPHATGGPAPVVVHDFDCTANGGLPVGPATWGSDGKLYGTTSRYGSTGQGVVWKLDPVSLGYSVLHTFAHDDGINASSGVAMGSDGWLYGAQPMGGTGAGCNTGCGTLYKVDPTKTDTQLTKNIQVLHAFDASLGEATHPYATPMLHTNGNLYGLTQSGANPHGYGVLYAYVTGMPPFAAITPATVVRVGDLVGMRGQGFRALTGVQFGTSPGLGKPYRLVSDAYVLVQVPLGACSGHLTARESTGVNLVTPQWLTVVDGAGRAVACPP